MSSYANTRNNWEPQMQLDWEKLIERQTVAMERLANQFCPPAEEPCRSWTVFIMWVDADGQRWTLDYGASNCDNQEQAVEQVISYISDMPADWKIHRVWAARATNIYVMDGYRFNPTPQYRFR